MTADAGTAAAPTAGPKLTVRCQFCLAWNRLDASRVADRPKCGKCAKPILLDRPLKLDEETFARTIAESQIPVFVDFYNRLRPHTALGGLSPSVVVNNVRGDHN